MPSNELKSLGEIDSLINLLINLIALGLMMSSVRDIAISEDWRQELRQVQSARLTMGLCLIPFALWGFYNTDYWIFLFAPVFALNADYALYGRSYPVTAAMIAFVRVFVPSAALLIVIQLNPAWAVKTFFFTNVLIYCITGIIISYILKQPYWQPPAWKNMRLYWRSLNLGIVTLSYYFIGLGLISIAVYFYNDSVIATAYIGCKLYLIFKGVLRIINQSFIKEMTDSQIQLRVDQLAGFAGFVFVAAICFFPNAFINLLLNKAMPFNKNILLILAVAGLITALFVSYINKVILEKKDKGYFIISIIASSAAISFCILFSYYSQSVIGIFGAILIGELINVLGLLKICGNRKELQLRIAVFGRYVLFLLIPLLAKVLLGDSFIALLAGIGSMSSVFLITYYKKFRL